MSDKDEWLMKETEQGFSIFVNVQNGQQRYDPPQWNLVCRQVLQCNKIWDDKYRLASKLFILQKELMWESVRLDVVSRVWQHHGLRREDNSMKLSPSTLRAVLEDVLFATSKDPSCLSDINVEVGAELTACYLWQLFDRERDGVMTLLSAKIALAMLCNTRPLDVWQFLTREAANHDQQVSERRLHAVLEALLSVPYSLGEEGQWGAEKEERVQYLLESCFTQEWVKTKDEASIIEWFSDSRNPLFPWFIKLARMRASAQVVYPGSCTVCKRRVLRGQVFRCNVCIWYWICQRCFLAGRCTLNHRLQHPVKDFIAPVAGVLEKYRAIKRIFQVDLCVPNTLAIHHYPTEPTLMKVPCVRAETPTSEPMCNLRQKLREMVTQLDLEGRKLQLAAAKWQSVQEASSSLQQHGKRLQSLGSQLSRLVYPTALLRYESTPMTTLRVPIGTRSAIVPRLLELSPIALGKSAMREQSVRQAAETDETCDLELSTILQYRSEYRAAVDPSISTKIQPAILPKNMSTTLDKLQSLLVTSSMLEDTFHNRDNEQLKQAISEFEEMLGKIIAGIEKTRGKTQILQE